MKKTVLTFGLISGAILSAMMLATLGRLVPIAINHPPSAGPSMPPKRPRPMARPVPVART